VRLDVHLGVLTSAADLDRLNLAEQAEVLGFDTVWTAESYGSDAVSVLAQVAARTSRIALGTAVMQIPARSATMTGMTAATLDLLSGGRLKLGLGVSGPQVSEGWHGVPFAAPLARTREYVDVVRAVLRGETVTAEGPHIRLPLPGGEGKPLRLRLHPVRPSVPVYLAAVGDRSVRLAGEIADGWLATAVPADRIRAALDPLAAGTAGTTVRSRPFDVVVELQAIVGDDIEACADQLRARAAMTLGGMGSRRTNFYRTAAAALGFASGVAEVEARFAAGDRAGAAAAVPFEYLDRTALLGPVARIAERMREYADAGATSLCLLLSGHSNGWEVMGQVAQAYRLSGTSER
jgi:F420-dependent oxidoreductase-like protein